ncbi:MAG: radical SAM family heme chaperone HemW [Negativicutes bacterium]|jgi:oxygen-independent coproporphyrinogen-3 oxidase
MWIEKMMTQPLGIYVHIPFCVKKCGYCDFASIEDGDSYFARYTDAVCEEIATSKYRGMAADTIFFGGGTPSLLPPEFLTWILAALRHTFQFSANCEISLEANPGTISEAKVTAWRMAGFNRVSVGVQSFDDDLLRDCGRIHSSQDARAALTLLRAGGYNNINVDLLSGLPGQTSERLLDSVGTAIDFGAKHISLYTLKIETGTKFAAALEGGELELPTEEIEDEMYDAAIHELASRKFARYEISNYALAGYECRHNLKYWQYQPYLGFGASAAMFCDGVRSTNVNSVHKYIEAITESISAIREQTTLRKTDAMSEYAFLGLRTAAGICLADFFELFAENFETVFAEALVICYKSGWLNKNGQHIFLTESGFKFGNQVFAEFI